MTIDMNDAQALADKYGYWGEHPEYTADDWIQEVFNGDTRKSYWQWVADCVADLTDED